MPDINGTQWTREEVHEALKDGRVEEVWPGGRFEPIDSSGAPVDREHWDGAIGRLWFADGSRVKINFQRVSAPSAGN
ncbi:gp25 [Mycobacterium phage Brujita]|uniref:Uncharacterized protein n=4 Tax=Caudoviricetes TaxID=2731619 RepID=A0A143FRE6_9CAUD|nr:gp25 [Mycobacterium phage Brujita]YP_009303782.1 hypothetical protein SEA_SHIPWRECK_24 [Mycobacterium phage Shipwreck]ADL71209.1 hypothetical protein ISLAND3_25 [Mycobacterium phage Island3]ASD53654.1 hypothetical protein SEA_BOGIE_24 [Mycobacterium phage Bogie]ACI06239.1 hypothetical protein BRUJITA_25 [Mycobacterium phage Brujita]AMW63843.1 hypothetical protein SEA_SHIPWRECK_24 [Mycobacterium phage Shipwreck]